MSRYYVALGDLSNCYGYAETAPPVSLEGAEALPSENAVVVAERTPVPDDTDGLTKATINKMCEYVAASAIDPHVVACANYAAVRMGRGQADPASCAWGVFWFLKHRVRRILDEGNMFRVGEAGASDMLIAPSVLLRMPNPAEDCDGFTMSAAAMLQAIGVPNCIATVACDSNDPQRWSHVFGLVQLANGEWIPLDCSHADAPGRYPRGLESRVSRFQAWDLSGNPIDVQMPRQHSPLRGYVGLGQSVCADGSIPDVISGMCNDGSTPGSGGYIAPEGGIPSITTSPASSTSGINWTSLFAGLATDATRVATVAELPTGASLTSSGSVIGAPYGTLNLSTLMPLIILGVGAFFLISLMERK